MDGLSIADLADTITKLGATGVLIVGIWAFITGKIWPNTMVEKALDAQREVAEKNAEIIGDKLAKDLSEGVRKGIAEGIAEGYLKINNRSKMIGGRDVR